MSISWPFISTYVYISSYFKKLTAESWHYQILTSLFPKIFIQWGTQKIQLLKMNADQTNSMWIRLGALQKYEDIYIIGLRYLNLFSIYLVGGIFKIKERKKEWKWCKIICSVVGNIVFFWGLWIFFLYF